MNNISSLNSLSGFIKGKIKFLPALNLDFTSGVLDPRITFSRSTSGSIINSSGFIETVTANTPRFTYDPLTLLPLGLLIEEFRTNLILRSAEIDNASWTKVDNTITANSIVSPDGGTNADLCTEGVAGTANISQGVTVTSGAIATASCFVKLGTLADWFQLSLVDTATGTVGVRAWFNLQVGIVSTISILGGSANTSARITRYGNDWFRLEVTMSIAATTGYTMSFASAGGDALTTRVNNSTYYLWGCQVECDFSFPNASTFASSYIPTTSATVYRNIDSAKITGSNFTNFFNATQGTVVAECYAPASVDQAVIVVSLSAAGTSNDCHEIAKVNSTYLAAGSRWVGHSNSAGGTTATIPTTTDVASLTGVAHKMAYAYRLNDYEFACNGVSCGVDTNGALPASVPTALYIGTRGASGIPFCGIIKKIKYFRRRLNRANLISQTIHTDTGVTIPDISLWDGNNKETILLALRKIFSVGPSSLTPTFTNSGVAHGEGSGAFEGAVSLPNGTVVFNPHTSDYVGLYNPIANVYTRGPALGIAVGLSHKFSGGTLHSNGLVYMSPYINANRVGIYNPTTNTFTTNSVATGSGWASIVEGSDGTLTCSPLSATNIGRYNPTTDTWTNSTPHGEGSNAFSSALPHIDGYIYFVPYNSANIGRYNYLTNTYSGIAHGVSGTAKYEGGIMTKDGIIVFVPNGATNILLYNPITDKVVLGPSGGGVSGRYTGGTLLGDGRVLFFCRNMTAIGIYNPYTNTMSTTSTGLGSVTHGGIGCGTCDNGISVQAPNINTNIFYIDAKSFPPRAKTHYTHPAYDKI